MACHGCGSDWVTGGNVIRPSLNGKDCTSCPYCCKLSRCKERKRGRWHGPLGEPFRPSVFKKKRRRAKRQSNHCHHCGQKLKPNQIKYCHRSCFYAARKAGTQKWDRTKQTEGCYHRGGRWNSAISKRYVRRVASLDRWLSKASSLWGRMWSLHQTQRHCEVCGTACNEGASRFCSYECTKAWRGIRICKCGKEVQNASALSRPACVDCKRVSRRMHRRMYGSYKRRCRTYGGYFNPDVKPLEVFKRDKWRCHVCGVKCHKVFRHDDPLSATIDHTPQPLSKGGDHDWHNVRCCCYRCNTLKGAKWDGQQRLSLG